MYLMYVMAWSAMVWYVYSIAFPWYSHGLHVVDVAGAGLGDFPEDLRAQLPTQTSLVEAPDLEEELLGVPLGAAWSNQGGMSGTGFDMANVHQFTSHYLIKLT